MRKTENTSFSCLNSFFEWEIPEVGFYNRLKHHKLKNKHFKKNMVQTTIWKHFIDIFNIDSSLF